MVEKKKEYSTKGGLDLEKNISEIERQADREIRKESK